VAWCVRGDGEILLTTHWPPSAGDKKSGLIGPERLKEPKSSSERCSMEGGNCYVYAVRSVGSGATEKLTKGKVSRIKKGEGNTIVVLVQRKPLDDGK